MSVEQYSNDVIVVTVADGPSNFKVWLREDAPTDLVSDLRWLREEYMDSHVVLDLADITSLEGASCKLMMDLQELVVSPISVLFCAASPRISSASCIACTCPTNSILLTPAGPPLRS
jgi:hypothetical protein